MKLIDISMPIEESMPTYKGRTEKRPKRTFDSQMPRDSINESSIHMNLHTGTHMDAPRHMIQDGWTMEDMPLEKLITRCKVLDLTGINEAITRADLEGQGIRAGDFILMKTRNSFGKAGAPDFVFIRHDAARYLADLGVKGVGTDALGVERDQPGHLTHKALMDANVLILEGLCLKNAPAGEYILIALPLSIPGAEGAPARAVLVDDLSKI